MVLLIYKILLPEDLEGDKVRPGDATQGAFVKLLGGTNVQASARAPVLGFDPIWFGVIVVMTVELGLIDPDCFSGDCYVAAGADVVSCDALQPRIAGYGPTRPP
jgi:hypothetical protein